MIFWKGEHSQAFRKVSFHPIGKFGCSLGILLNHLAQQGFNLVSVRCIEDGSDIGRYLPLHTLARHVLARNLLKMELPTLSRNATEEGDACSLIPHMRVAYFQVYTVRASFHQALQGVSPLQLLLA